MPAADQVGDPAADRRIRNIVLALGALALIVLITTIIFWRKTKPVPAALDGLRRLGTRSGRQAALAVEAAGVAPPSVAGGGVARPGVSIRPAAAVAVAEGASVADGGGSADGGAPVADRDARAGVGSASMADAEVPVERNGAPLAAPPEPEPSAVERVSSAVEPAAGPESIVSAAPPADVVPASSDEPGPPPAVPGPPPAAEVVTTSAPPPSPGTSLRKDG